MPLEEDTVPEDGIYAAGTVALARSVDPDSGGSQFFIVYEDSLLPGGYTVFGHVTKGLDVVQHVASAGSNNVNGPGDGAPIRAIGLRGVEVS